MPTHKPDLSELTASQLRELTGMALPTISKRLAGVKPCRETGREVYFNPKLALPALFGTLNPMAEKARLDSARADLAELDLALKRAEVVDGADQDKLLIALATATSARVLAGPAKLAMDVASESDPTKCQAIMEREAHEVLRDLSDAGRQAARRLEAERAKSRTRARRNGAAAEAERPRVGRSQEGASAGLA